MEIVKNNSDASTWVLKPGKVILAALHVLVVITSLAVEPPVYKVHSNNAVKALP